MCFLYKNVGFELSWECSNASYFFFYFSVGHGITHFSADNVNNEVANAEAYSILSWLVVNM